MDIPKRKPRLNLPYDCNKLSIEDCENPRYQNKCIIESSFFNRNEKCIANEDYLIDREFDMKGFKDLIKINYTSEEDLIERDELCQSLSSTSCRSAKARMLGCQYQTNFFKKGRCKLADKIINYYYSKSKKCLCKDCEEEKEIGFKLCNEHRLEFEELLEELLVNYKDIMESKNIEDNYDNFIRIYNDLNDRFKIYLTENMATLIQITEKLNAIRLFLGESNCQCVNIKTCIGKGSIGNFCENKGLRNNLGFLCKEHTKCFQDRKKKFNDFKKTFQKLCGVKSCKKELEELENFYRMILFCTEGESFIYKNELIEFLFIIRQYVKEIS